MKLTTPYSPGTPIQVKLADGSVRDVPARMTVDEFAAFPWPEGEGWELIWETPVLTPQPLPAHQRLESVLEEFIKERLRNRPELGVYHAVDLRLPKARSYVSPDIIVINEASVDLFKRPITAIPLLVVEILSPSNADIDMGPKRDAYAEAGVGEYWTVDPQNQAVSIRLNPQGGEYQEFPPAVDGYVRSPLIDCAFRFTLDGNSFHILARD